MKRKMVLGLLSALLVFNIDAQIDVKQKVDKSQSDSTEGFFVKNGAMKLSALDCYNFNNLIVAFNIDESYFKYDEISIEIFWGLGSDLDEIRLLNIKKSMFNKQFSTKDKYAYFSVFKTTDLKEESLWEFNRSDMQYTTSNNFLSCYFCARVYGRNIINTETEYVTSTDGSVVARERESWSDYTKLNSFDIPMKNRVKVSPLAKKFNKLPAPTTTSDCYK